MAWSEDYRAGHVAFQDASMGSPEYVYGITNINASANPEVAQEKASGSVYPDSVAHSQTKPMIAFTTVGLEDAITALGLLGKCITNDVGKPGLDVYCQKQTCAGVLSGAVHRKLNIGLGLIVPRSLTVDHMNSAQLVYEAYAAWDGTNDPIQKSDTGTLPTYPAETWPTPPQGRWTMRGLTIGAVSVTGKRNVSIDFGAVVTHESGDSDPYPTVATLSELKPRMTVRGVDPKWWSTVTGLAGGSVTHANTTLELRKRGIALNVAAHITITLAGLVYMDTLFSAGLDGPGEAVLVVESVYDGTNAPILVSTGQTLS